MIVIFTAPMSLRNSANYFLRWYTCRSSSSYCQVFFPPGLSVQSYIYWKVWHIFRDFTTEFVLLLASFTRIELTVFCFLKTNSLRKHPTFCDATKVVFPRMDVWRFASANQKHYPDEGSDTSSVWNLKMKKWSSQWTQFMQLHKEAWKKNSGLQRGLNPWPRDLPVRCSTNWAMKPLTLGAGQLWVHMLMIYEINHIWTAEMKWKWRNDRRSMEFLRRFLRRHLAGNQWLHRENSAVFSGYKTHNHFLSFS